MKKLSVLLFIAASMSRLFAQVEFTNLYPVDSITEVQPMTGLVFWNTSGNNNTDAIALEFSYMLFNDVVTDSGDYHWDAVETKLDDIAGRGHQAIFRFRYVYPGYKTSVPQYILDRADYNETVGLSEGRTTHFPDWTNPELQRFSLEFYTKFAERYDNDPRLAFIQVGFGLWAEYHIYDGPFKLGETFPSKAFQETFFYHLDKTFKNIPWSISIDAADAVYTPFKAKPELKDLKFGVFDDSFMHKDHSGWNESEWNFFDRERYKISPAGGEFSYYSNYDQTHMLDLPNGPYGKSYETFARNFHISYMLANDQPRYHPMERIKQASMSSGYRFKIVSLRTAADTCVFEILNYGVAPIYYDAYISVDGKRSTQSLKGLAPGDTLICSIQASAENAEISIESDKILSTQKIQFHGTQELSTVKVAEVKGVHQRQMYPNPVKKGESVYYSGDMSHVLNYTVYNLNGELISSGNTKEKKGGIDTSGFSNGIYIVRVIEDKKIRTNRLVVL